MAVALSARSRMCSAFGVADLREDVLLSDVTLRGLRRSVERTQSPSVSVRCRSLGRAIQSGLLSFLLEGTVRSF